MSAKYIGSVTEYNEDEPFSSYTERFEQYIIVNDVSAQKKVPLFLTIIGPKCYDILRNSVLPDKPSDKPYEELKSVLSFYYLPEKCIIAERYRFHKRLKPNESIPQFCVELKSVAQQCNFGTFLDDALRDQFICGVKDEHIGQKLLVESTLTFNEAIKIAVSMELAATQIKSMAGTADIVVGKITQETSKQPQKHIPSDTEGRKNTCRRCGGKWDSDHLSTCRAKNVKCHKCGTLGHYARVCRKKQQRPVNEIHEEHTTPVTEGNKECQCMRCTTEINDIYIVDIDRAGLEKTLYVQNKKMNFEVDTGAALTVMSLHDFKQQFSNTVHLDTSHISLRSASGNFLNVIGKATVMVSEKRNILNKPTSFIVIRENIRIPLLGRDWLNQLRPNWREELLQIDTVKSNSSSRFKIPEQFNQVFTKDKKASIVGFKANIVLKENVTPVFKKAYGIPYKILDEVDRQIEEFVKKGLWTPLRFSEWASPLVVVDKKSGGLRLCVDYKGTVNPNIERDMYPLPKLDDILTSLAGGKVFCTLDLSSAYTQLELSEESKKILVINTHKGLFATNRLPFGVSSAPGIFQSVMDTIPGKMKGVCCYLDDLIISGKDEKECKERLYTVLHKLKEFAIKVNLDKCEFFKGSVKYLGHLIDGNGIKPKEEFRCYFEMRVSKRRNAIEIIFRYA